MAVNLKLPKVKKSKKVKIKKSEIPNKNYINLMVRKKQTFNKKKHLPIVIILALLFLVFCKFMVLDRVLGITEMTNNVTNMKNELAQTERQINEMSDMEDMYAHYTTSGMTEDELSRVDRVQAMKMVDKAFTGGSKANSWNLTGNIMTLQVAGSSLAKLNALASDIETNSIVERCVISSADKGRDEKGNVVVTFTIYLKQSGSGNQ